MNYNISFQSICLQLVPSFLRGTKFISLIYSIIKPLKDLNSGVTISDYSASSTYAIGDKVRYNNIYYLCREEIAVPESFTLSKWVDLGMFSNFYNLTQIISNFLKYDSKQLYLELFLNKKYDPTLSEFDEYNVANDTYIKDNVLLTNADNKPRIQVLSNTTTTKFLYNLSESSTPFYLYNYYETGGTYTAGERVVYLTKIYECILGHTNKIPTDPTYWTEQSTVSYFYNKGGGSYSYDFIVMVPSGLLGTRLAEFESDIKKYKLAGKTYSIITY